MASVIRKRTNKAAIEHNAIMAVLLPEVFFAVIGNRCAEKALIDTAVKDFGCCLIVLEQSGKANDGILTLASDQVVDKRVRIQPSFGMVGNLGTAEEDF
jgi:hypothetical protein